METVVGKAAWVEAFNRALESLPKDKAPLLYLLCAQTTFLSRQALMPPTDRYCEEPLDSVLLEHLLVGKEVGKRLPLVPVQLLPTWGFLAVYGRPCHLHYGAGEAVWYPLPQLDSQVWAE